MEYKGENRIPREQYHNLLDEYGVSVDDHIFRNLAIKMVTDMPFNDLKGIFYFNKIDPFSIKNKELLNDVIVSEYEKGRILILQSKDIVLFESKLVY